MKKIIIFGRGKYFKFKKISIEKDYQIIAVLDSSVESKTYDNELKCYIYNPRFVDKLPYVDILLCSVKFIEMWKQLIMLGVPSRRIKLTISIRPFFYDYERIISQNGKILIEDEAIVYFQDRVNKKNVIRETSDYKRLVLNLCFNEYKEVQKIPLFSVKPISRMFGGEFGKPVDRVYIERFLENNKELISGVVMEIESDDYIKRFGEDRVTDEIILHVKGWGGPNVLKGNFETGEGLEENMVDCLICTQTLQYIYDLKSTVKNIYKILKPGGTVLLTVPGIKSLSRFHDSNWGEQWSFTEKSVNRMFSDVFGTSNVSIEVYGNVKIATAYLYGLSSEMLRSEDFEYNDDQFPFIIAARVKKETK